MVSRTFNIFAPKAPPKATRDALDVAARYFVYKLYDATRREPMQWVALKGIDEASATIARAAERRWVVLQGVGGKSLDRKAALTDEGRRLARKGR
jgi:type II secretory pathway component PulK